MNESVFVPQWKKTGSDDDVSHIQLNPSAAIEQSKERAKRQQMIAGIGMVIVLLVVVVGGLTSVQQQQTTSVEASLNLKRAIRGIVTTVDYDAHTFEITYESSQDPNIIDTGIKNWTVALPPGTQFLSGQTQRTCYEVERLSGNLANRASAPCERVVNLGDSVIVEYLFLTSESAEMVAKTIISEQ